MDFSICAVNSVDHAILLSVAKVSKLTLIPAGINNMFHQRRKKYLEIKRVLPALSANSYPTPTKVIDPGCRPKRFSHYTLR